MRGAGILTNNFAAVYYTGDVLKHSVMGGGGVHVMGGDWGAGERGDGGLLYRRCIETQRVSLL